MAIMTNGYYGVEEYFEEEDVWVTVPTQAKARPLVIRRLTIPDLGQMPATPNVFEPIRPVINFQVEEQEEKEEEDAKPVYRFSPPIVLRVGFTEDDVEQVGGGSELKLAFWDGSRWVLFTKKKHHFKLHSRYAVALIRHWGDPTVALGK